MPITNARTGWTPGRVGEVIGKRDAAALPAQWLRATAAKLNALDQLIRDAGFDPEMPGLGVRLLAGHAGVDYPAEQHQRRRAAANAHQHKQCLTGTLAAVAKRRTAIAKGYKRADPQAYARMADDLITLWRMPAGDNALAALAEVNP